MSTRTHDDLQIQPRGEVFWESPSPLLYEHTLAAGLGEIAHNAGSCALAGDLDDAEYRDDPVLGLAIPTAIEGVPTEILTPRDTWSDTDAFDAQARKLATMFQDNFAQYAGNMDSSVQESGPRG